MSYIAYAIKNLKNALEKEDEIPTVSEIAEITGLVSKLTTKVVNDDNWSEEESDEESDKESDEAEEWYTDWDDEDVSSVEESSDDDDSSSDDDEEDSNEDSEEESKAKKKEIDSKEKKNEKRQPSARALGYRLYMDNGGTRASWAKKSEKYKNTYYELRHLYQNKSLKK